MILLSLVLSILSLSLALALVFRCEMQKLFIIDRLAELQQAAINNDLKSRFFEVVLNAQYAFGFPDAVGKLIERHFTSEEMEQLERGMKVMLRDVRPMSRTVAPPVAPTVVSIIPEPEEDEDTRI